jgi:hypothetical protein
MKFLVGTSTDITSPWILGGFLPEFGPESACIVSGHRI